MYYSCNKRFETLYMFHKTRYDVFKYVLTFKKTLKGQCENKGTENICYKNEAYYSEKRRYETRDVFRWNAQNTDHNNYTLLIFFEYEIAV